MGSALLQTMCMPKVGRDSCTCKPCMLHLVFTEQHFNGRAGLKLGIYSDSGSQTCAKYTASLAMRPLMPSNLQTGMWTCSSTTTASASRRPMCDALCREAGVD